MSPKRRAAKKKSSKALAAPPSTAALANPAFSGKQDWLNGVTAASASSVAQALTGLSPSPAADGPFAAPGIGHGATQIAAEQVGHLLDGWRYLSAAFYATMTNSPQSSVHYCYYAELRAAFSLLASTGLRVRFRDSYYVDSSGAVIPLSTWNTHSCIWAVWGEWQKRADVAQTFQRTIKIHPLVTLGDLMQALNSHIASSVIGSWGLDLVEPIDDHDLRNTASYEPVGAVERQTALSADSWGRLLRVWELMLPSVAGINFDEALSAYCFYTYAVSLTGERDVGVLVGLPEFKRVTAVLENQLAVGQNFFSNVLHKNSEHFELFEAASQKGNATDNVLLRALFLLRVASGFVSHVLPAESPVRERINGWMDLVGLIRPGLPVRVADLSEDYIEALDSVPRVASQHQLCGVEVDRPGMKLSRIEGVLAWAI